MKLAVTSQGPDLDGEIDRRFGRARYFVLFDTETGELVALDNAENLDAAQGAGIQAAGNVIDAGAGAVISGSVGPKAFASLRAGGVAVYLGAEGTVKDVIERFKSGRLSPADEPGM